MSNLPPGAVQEVIDRLLDEEPEYELTEADLEEAYLDNLEQQASALPGPVFYECDALLVDARIEDAIWERLVGGRAA